MLPGKPEFFAENTEGHSGSRANLWARVALCFVFVGGCSGQAENPASGPELK